MRAYHNDPDIKAKYLARVEEHSKADQILQNYGYWSGGKGCAVGCTIHGRDHAAYETELGIPREIAHLEDAIFEGLPVELAKTWPGEFLGVISVGADLSLVWPTFALWMLTDHSHGVLRHTKDDAQSAKAINDIAALFSEWIGTGSSPADSRWAAAEDAAEDAAMAAAMAAAREAAMAAAWAAAWAADGAAWWIAARGKLLELLAGCK